MRSKIVNYDFSEDDKQIIVSRLLGEHFTKRTEGDKEFYCGYIKGTLCEIVFDLEFTFAVYRYTRKGKFEMTYPKWGNYLFQKLLEDKTLNLKERDRADFNRYAYVEVTPMKEFIDFCFRYKPMEDAV